jgi:hypothetical protein
MWRGAFLHRATCIESISSMVHLVFAIIFAPFFGWMLGIAAIAGIIWFVQSAANALD